MSRGKITTHYLDNLENRILVAKGMKYVEWCETEIGVVPRDGEVAAHILDIPYSQNNERLLNAGRFFSILLSELNDRSVLPKN